MVRSSGVVFIFDRFDLSDVEGGGVFRSSLAGVIIVNHLLLSRELLLSLVKVVNDLPPTRVVSLRFQLRHIRALRSGELVISLSLHIFRLDHLVIFFLCCSFTTLSISFLICRPSGISRCHIWSIHTLFSTMLLNDKWVIGRSLQIVSIFPALIEFYRVLKKNDLLYRILVYFDSGF